MVFAAQTLLLALLTVGVVQGQVPIPNRRLPPRVVGGIADLTTHCSVHTEGVTIDGQGLRLGGLLELNEMYSAASDRCSQFGGWSSVQQSSALMFALHQASRFLPHRGVQLALSQADEGSTAIGADIYDSCASALLGITEAQLFASETELFQQSTLTVVSQSLGVDSVDCVNRFNSSMSLQSPLYGIVGPMSNGAVTGVSPLLSTYNLPHISYWASSTLFDDVDDYPFLFRTVPSDAFQAAAIADLIEHFGWDLVSLIAADDEEYSGRGFELLRSEAANRQTFCLDIVARISERPSANRTRTVVRRLASSRARAVILYAPTQAAVSFFTACEKENLTGKIFVGSHDWVNRVRFEGSSYLTSLPIVGLAPRSLLSTPAQVVKQLHQALHNASYIAGAVQTDHWLRTYVEQQLGCRVALVYPDDDCLSLSPPQGTGQVPPRPGSGAPPSGRQRTCEMSDYRRFRPRQSMVIAESVLASIIALGFGIANAALGTDFNSLETPSALPSGVLVRQHLLNLTMPCNDMGVEKQCRVFTSEQSTRPAYYIQNLQALPHGGHETIPVGLWDPTRGITWLRGTSMDLKTHGSYSLASLNTTGGVTQENVPNFPTSNCSTTCMPGEYRMFPGSFERCCWRCPPCPGNTYSNTTNADVCLHCPLGFQSNTIGCVPIPPARLHLTGVEFLTSIVLAVIGFFLVLFTLIYYHTHKLAVLVRASDISLSTVSLCGMLVGFAAVPFINIEGVPTNGRCVVSSVLAEPLKTVVISAVLVKTKRFNSVFNSMKILSRHKRRRFLLGTPMQLLTITLLTAVNVILSLLYGLLSTPRAVTVLGVSSVEVYCEINVVWVAVMSAYNCVLLITCIVLAFLTRKLPEGYNEAQLVYLASLTGFVVWLGLVPAFFITGRTLRPLISALSLGCLLLAFWLCLFAPRMVQMLMHAKYRLPREKTVVKPSTNRSGGHDSPYSTPQPGRKLYTESPLLPRNERSDVDGQFLSAGSSQDNLRPTPSPDPCIPMTKMSSSGGTATELGPRKVSSSSVVSVTVTVDSPSKHLQVPAQDNGRLNTRGQGNSPFHPKEDYSVSQV